MIVQQKRYWNLNIYLKTLYFILYLIDLLTLISSTKSGPLPELDGGKMSSAEHHANLYTADWFIDKETKGNWIFEGPSTVTISRQQLKVMKLDMLAALGVHSNRFYLNCCLFTVFEGHWMESDSWYSKRSLAKMVGHSVGQGPQAHLALFLFVRLLPVIVSSDDNCLLFPTEQQNPTEQQKSIMTNTTQTHWIVPQLHDTCKEVLNTSTQTMPCECYALNHDILLCINN